MPSIRCSVSTFGVGGSGHEIRYRYQAVGRSDAKLVQRVDPSIFDRVAHADVHAIIGPVRTVFADFDPRGHELYGDAHLADVGTVDRGLCTVHGEVPLDAG